MVRGLGHKICWGEREVREEGGGGRGGEKNLTNSMHFGSVLVVFKTSSPLFPKVK